MPKVPEYQSGIRPVASKGPAISRRKTLIAAASAAGWAAGIFTDRALLGLPGLGVARSPTAETRLAPSATTTSNDPRMYIDLRPLKPYDWLTEPIVGLGGHARPEDGSTGFVWRTMFDVTEHAVIEASGVDVVAVAVPAAVAPLIDVQLVAVGRPTQLTERLRDMGNPADIAQLVEANGVAPRVGDLWIFIPRDEPWQPGGYQITARSQTTDWSFSFSLT
ncbi:MAG: hypothetical protein ACRDF7_00110 [Candidatus Limnocylindrales bacterium]